MHLERIKAHYSDAIFKSSRLGLVPNAETVPHSHSQITAANPKVSSTYSVFVQWREPLEAAPPQHQSTRQSGHRISPPQKYYVRHIVQCHTDSGAEDSGSNCGVHSIYAKEVPRYKAGPDSHIERVALGE